MVQKHLQGRLRCVEKHNDRYKPFACTGFCLACHHRLVTFPNYAWFLHLPGSMMLRQMRTTAAYWCLPLIGAHLGLNWNIILNAFHKMTKINGEDRTRKIVMRTLAFAVAAFGVWSSLDRNIFSKLFLGFSFDYWPEERPVILFFAINLSIMGMYVFVTYYTFGLLERRKQK
jgi:hypothetical protein